MIISAKQIGVRTKYVHVQPKWHHVIPFFSPYFKHCHSRPYNSYKSPPTIAVIFISWCHKSSLWIKSIVDSMQGRPYTKLKRNLFPIPKMQASNIYIFSLLHSVTCKCIFWSGWNSRHLLGTNFNANFDTNLMNVQRVISFLCFKQNQIHA